MTHPFEYRKPTDEQALLMADQSALFEQAYDHLIARVAGSAERTIAIRKLQEARMWTNVAILGIEVAK